MSSSSDAYGTWSAVPEALLNLCKAVYGDARLSADPVLVTESARYLTSLLGTGVLMAMDLADPDYPQLAKLWNTYSSWGMNNPDCVFLYSAVRADATYRIHGRRGSVKVLAIQTGDSHMTSLPNYRCRSNVSGFEARADGSIEIMLSTAPCNGNWVPLEPGVEWILLRQYFSDWEREEPSDLIIERLGATYPPPLLTQEMLAPRIARLTNWLRSGAIGLQAMADSFLKVPAGRVVFAPDPYGMGGVFNGRGYFECEPDQAVILEVTPPKCEYWSFQLTNLRWESLDWHLRQTSLNHHQARIDEDGVFRAVISHSDPGIPNWLDPQGHSKGLIGGRYFLATAMPEARSQVVPLQSIRKHLHPRTATITAEERSEVLRRRMLGAHLRFRQ